MTIGTKDLLFNHILAVDIMYIKCDGGNRYRLLEGRTTD